MPPSRVYSKEHDLFMSLKNGRSLLPSLEDEALEHHYASRQALHVLEAAWNPLFLYGLYLVWFSLNAAMRDQESQELARGHPEDELGRVELEVHLVQVGERLLEA